MSTRQATGILHLPPEIVLDIFEDVGFESHWSLASSCKQMYGYARQILKRHQHAYAKYRVISDLHPSTIPELLRAAVLDTTSPRGFDLELWHIRKVEIWNDRESWNDWRPVALYKPPWLGEPRSNDWKTYTSSEHLNRPSWVEQYRLESGELTVGWQTVSKLYFDQTVSPERWDFKSGELQAYMATAEAILPFFPNDSKEMQVQLARGVDASHKILLLALCPRLREITVVHSPKTQYVFPFYLFFFVLVIT